MIRLPFLLVALALVCACSDTSTNPVASDEPELMVSFGFEPTPFAPYNQLGAVLNDLNAIQTNINGMEPLDFQGMEPLDKQAMEPLDIQAMEPLDRQVFGLWGQLGAMEKKLWLLNARTSSAVAVPPDPCCEVEFLAMRTAVADAASAISNDAMELAQATVPFGTPPSADNLLVKVSDAAMAIRFSALPGPG